MPLGVLLKNENKYEDTIDIMSHLQQYVPVVTQTKQQLIPSIGEVVEITQDTLYQILFGGDQLTASCAQGT